ncbi:MAG TPA: hypothetical protein VFG69_21640 [Nannocystaceae bacterium]|nr:hypothetical protein [Nannocystaceae bacterium]
MRSQATAALAPTADPVEVQLSQRRPGHAAGCLGSLWIGVWASEQRVPDLESARTTLQRLAREQSTAPCALTIVVRGAPIMSADVRRCGVETARALASVIDRAAVVVEGDGLWASMIVSLVTHLVLPARISRIVVHRTLLPAAQYLAGATELTPETIASAVETLRRAC